MSQEAVKLVIFVSGGVVQDILTCGVPIEVALIDYDVDDMDMDETIAVPNIDSASDRARVSHWIIHDQTQQEMQYANNVFTIAKEIGDAP